MRSLVILSCVILSMRFELEFYVCLGSISQPDFTVDSPAGLPPRGWMLTARIRNSYCSVQSMANRQVIWLKQISRICCLTFTLTFLHEYSNCFKVPLSFSFEYHGCYHHVTAAESIDHYNCFNQNNSKDQILFIHSLHLVKFQCKSHFSSFHSTDLRTSKPKQIGQV